MHTPIISEDVFNAMDRNKDGFVSKGELKLAQRDISMNRLAAIIDSIDSDGDGKLNYAELKAALNKEFDAELKKAESSRKYAEKWHKSASKSDCKSASTDSKSGHKSASKSDRTDSKSGPKSAPTDSTKSGQKSASKSDSKTDHKSASKPDSKSQHKSAPKSKPDSKSSRHSDPK